MSSKTNEKVVLVTGTSSGFGRHMAETFARAGYRVYAGMRAIEGKNAPAKAELDALADSGLALEVLALDVTDDEQIDAAVARILDQAGCIDVLVNNAGISVGGPCECSTTEQARGVFETNYFGPVRLCRAVLPSMRARRSGLIIQISSITGRATLPSTSHYGASKAALETFSELLHYELAAFGVDVAIVEPGLYETEFFDNMPRPDDRARLAEYGELADKIEQGIAIAKQMMAAKRRDPQEVADLALRLAEMPAGERPLRTLVGEDAAMLEPINAVAGPLVEAMFKAYGFV